MYEIVIRFVFGKNPANRRVNLIIRKCRIYLCPIIGCCVEIMVVVQYANLMIYIFVIGGDLSGIFYVNSLKM